MHEELVRRFVQTQALLLAPICPHVAEQIWKLTGHVLSFLNRYRDSIGMER